MERTDAGHRAYHVASRGELKCAGGVVAEIVKRISTVNCAHTSNSKRKSSKRTAPHYQKPHGRPGELSAIGRGPRRPLAKCGSMRHWNDSHRIYATERGYFGAARVSALSPF